MLPSMSSTPTYLSVLIKCGVFASGIAPVIMKNNQQLKIKAKKVIIGP